MFVIRKIFYIARRECGILAHNPIYLFCMIGGPLIVILFFTSLMDNGQPTDMPCGIVDLDNTSTTRAMTRKLDAFEMTKVTAYYNSVDEAREAIQRGDIYAFLYFPKGTTDKILANRQPTISFYYNGVVMLAGNMMYKDLTTVTTLGSAAVGAAKLSALGKTPVEIKAFLQPVSVNLHMIGNPWANYNVYLSTIMIPGILFLFYFLITAYSIGTELKFNRAHEWMRMADNNIFVAIAGKTIPQFMVFFTVFMCFSWYIYGYLGFPHPGGIGKIVLLALLTVLAAQGFGIFAFGLMPSLRMSMSICSLWGVVGFSAAGATYPVFAMDSMIEAIAQLIPLRHYYMIYQICIFNGYPLSDAWPNIAALIIFAALPLLTLWNVKKAMLNYVYIP
ncbi:ABC transporter permease [Prevotella lacticifex]